VDLFHAGLNGDAVYPPVLDAIVLVMVVLAFIYLAKILQKRNLVKGL
jgi:ABC-2 type transport system permease protein